MISFPSISQIDMSARRRLEIQVRCDMGRQAEMQGKPVIRSFWKGGKPWVIVEAQSRVPKVRLQAR